MSCTIFTKLHRSRSPPAHRPLRNIDLFRFLCASLFSQFSYKQVVAWFGSIIPPVVERVSSLVYGGRNTTGLCVCYSPVSVVGSFQQPLVLLLPRDCKSICSVQTIRRGKQCFQEKNTLPYYFCKQEK